MRKTMAGAFKLMIAAMLALAIGTGAVFALNQPGPRVNADAVAVLKSQGVTCGSCAARIEKALKEKAGVASVEVDVEGGRVMVAYDAKLATPEALAAAVTGAGYGSSVLQTMTADQYRAVTGKELTGRPAKSGCACCADRQAGK